MRRIATRIATNYLIDFSLHWQSPSPSQMPLVCPRVTQLAVQAQLPRVHRNPALATVAMLTNNRAERREEFMFTVRVSTND